MTNTIDKTYHTCIQCDDYIGEEHVAICDKCAESIDEFNKRSDALFFAGVEVPHDSY